MVLPQENDDIRSYYEHSINVMEKRKNTDVVKRECVCVCLVVKERAVRPVHH